MLSRIATNCLWLARYLERAENNSRLISVAHAQSLLPEFHHGDIRPWQWLLHVAAEPSTWSKLPEHDADLAALAVMMHDREHASSLWSCLRSVRENARTARFSITNAMWEASNTTWIEARALDHDTVATRGVDDMLAWAVNRCQWIRGTIEDLLDDEISRVLSIGRALERFDATCRVLAEWMPIVRGEGVAITEPGTSSYRLWDSFLSVGAVQDWYRRLNPTPGDLERSVDLIALNRRQPRSLAVSARRLCECLSDLGAGRKTTSIAAATALHDTLSTMQANDLITQPECLLGLIEGINDLTNTIGIDHCGMQEQEQGQSQ